MFALKGPVISSYCILDVEDVKTTCARVNVHSSLGPSEPGAGDLQCFLLCFITLHCRDLGTGQPVRASGQPVRVRGQPVRACESS